MTLGNRNHFRRSAFGLLFALLAVSLPCVATAAELLAGAAKVDVTNEDTGPVNDRLFVRALVLKQDQTTVVLVTVDAVAIGEIGPIGNDYLGNVRSVLTQDLGLTPTNILFNASHCHGIVTKDIDQRTITAVKEAHRNLVPVKVGVGVGREDRVSENRRLKLKSGKEADVRHAYSLPPDDAVAEVGPIDPEIGVLRLDRMDGRTLAVVYNFACHPIQSVPGNANTADMTGFSSKVIEENTSEGAVALFVQGCGGDINPVFYKDVDHPRHAEPLGNMLGLSTLRAYRKIETKGEAKLAARNETITLPRADTTEKIAFLESEQTRLLQSLRGTSLNLKTFLPLAVKYNLSKDYPSGYSHRYLQEKAIGQENLAKMDAENRRNLQAYIANIETMEQLTRVQTNLALLKRHQAKAAGSRTFDVEVAALRVGDFVMVMFPGELTVRIGLGIKKRSPHPRTFVAGYSNGYIYYTPTAEQLLNVGNAQEDSDCMVAPEWQKVFDAKVDDLLKRI